VTEVVLVTGGAGYFGSLLVSRLAAGGRRVRIFDVNDAEDRAPGVEMARGDIRDAGAVARACEGVSVIHHNVAMVPLAKDKTAFWSVNRDGTRILLEAAARAGVRKVVHTSSSAVFGAPEKNPVDDATVPRPQEEYGRAKLAAEEICRSHVAKGLDVTILRPRTIMGHGRLGIMQILFEWIAQGRNVPVLGEGDNLYQFVHADDLAAACLAAADRAGPATYNIGAEEFATMRETLEGLISHAGSGSRVVTVPAATAVAMMKLTSKMRISPLGAYHALMYGRSMYFDLAKAKRELGYRPRFGNVEMFIDSYEWYLRNRGEVLGRRGSSLHRSPVKQGVLRAVSWALRFAPGAKQAIIR
jgi:nucleoside-diphosphate-sugar epimerase